MSRIQDLLALSHVPRWSIVNTNHYQSVAEHSFRVVALSMELAHGLEMDLGPVLEWAVVHDGAESTTGDMPSPLKEYLKGFGDEDAMRDCDGLEEALCEWYKEASGSAAAINKDIVHAADLIEQALYLEELPGYPKGGLDSIHARIVRKLHRCIEHIEKSYEFEVGQIISDLWRDARSTGTPWTRKDEPKGIIGGASSRSL